MAKITAGDLREITVNHPDVGTVSFSTKANESYTIDPGGNRSVDDAGMITGSGEMIDQINVVRWSFEGPIIVSFSDREAMTKLPLMSGSSEQGTWTFTHVSGEIWRAKGKPVGDIQIDTNTAQMTAKISGGGILESL